MQTPAHHHRHHRLRRTLLLTALCSGVRALPPRSAHAQATRLKIGIIGTGRIGSALAKQLLRDAGFEPVVGGLVRARDFDIGTPVFGRALTARELRQALGLQS